MSTTAVQVLPKPQDHPQADIVIFDGNCQFCRRQVERLKWLDGRDRLAFISLHDPMVAEKFPDLSHDQLMKEMYVIDRHGKRYAGASSIRYFSRRLPLLWWLAPLIHVPGTLPIWKWLYQQVAQRRYMFNRPTCEGDACAIHFKKK